MSDGRSSGDGVGDGEDGVDEDSVKEDRAAGDIVRVNRGSIKV
jgi:hypothetical protein